MAFPEDRYMAVNAGQHWTAVDVDACVNSWAKHGYRFVAAIGMVLVFEKEAK